MSLKYEPASEPLHISNQSEQDHYQETPLIRQQTHVQSPLDVPGTPK